MVQLQEQYLNIFAVMLCKLCMEVDFGITHIQTIILMEEYHLHTQYSGNTSSYINKIYKKMGR